MIKNVIFFTKMYLSLEVVSKVKILYHKGRKGNSQKSQRFEYQYFQFSALCAFSVFFVVKLTFVQPHELFSHKISVYIVCKRIYMVN